MAETPAMSAAQLNARQAADQLADQLQRLNQRIVFGESCTAGLVSATLAQRPGISGWLIGSAVTYRQSAKVAWLGVPESTLKEHTAESAATTEAMARQLLERTLEADLAVAVTGHLGPGAPPAIDGHLWIAGLHRHHGELERCHQVLQATERVERQWEATAAVLRWAAEQLGSRWSEGESVS